MTKLGSSLQRCMLILSVMAACIALVAMPSASAAGTNYYVDSANGSDSNSGTSISSPWKSLSPIQNRTFSPGDTINLARGSYWSAHLSFGSSGAAGSPITIKAYGSGAVPTISSTSNSVIDVNGSYLVIQDLLLRDAVAQGIYSNSSASHNVYQNNEIVNVGEGIELRGPYNLVTRNYLHDLHMIQNTGASTDYGAEGVVIWGGGAAHHNEVSYNRFVNCRASSAAFEYDGGVVEFWQNSDNTYVHHNYSTGCNGFFEVGGGAITNTTIAYNISDRDYGAFSVVHPGGQFAATLSNFKVDNNTIIRTDAFKWSVLDWDNNPAPSTYQFRNNIVHANTHQISLSGSFTRNNNLYYPYGGSVLGFSLGSGEKQVDPRFANFGAGDYHLQSGSPAVNAGVNLGYSLDFDGKPVPAGAAPDLGAFEYGASTSPSPTAIPTQPPSPPTATANIPANPPAGNPILADGPLAYWRLGERSGSTATDSSGSGYHGTYTGGVSLGAPGAIASDSNTAAIFNGTDGFVSVPSLPGASDFTVEGWTKLDPSAANNANGNNRIYGLAGQMRITVRPGAGSGFYGYYASAWIGGVEYELQGDTPNNIGSWVHWALVRQGNTLAVYRNGQMVGQRADLPSGPVDGIRGFVGADTSNSYLHGQIDEVALYSKALTATQVQNHYNYALAPAPNPIPTNTAVPPSPTPKASPTNVPQPSPTPTKTAVPASPTPTNTAVPPSPTPTNTAVPPSPTPKATSTVAPQPSPSPTQGTRSSWWRLLTQRR